MVIETARVLLATKFQKKNSLGIHSSLKALLYGDFFISDSEDLGLLSITLSPLQLALIADLVKILVIHGVPKMTESYDYVKMQWMTEILGDAQTWVSMLPGALEYPNPMAVQAYTVGLNSIMDSCADIISYFSLSETEENICGLLNKAGTTFYEYCLLDFALYSSQPGRSTKLIRYLLNDMRSSQIKELKMKLTKSLRTMTDETLEEIQTCTMDALNWVSKETTPRSLQHLVRHRINRAMSHRALGDASSLNIPKHLVSYLLLESNY